VATSINYEGLPPVAPEFDAAALRANIPPTRPPACVRQCGTNMFASLAWFAVQPVFNREIGFPRPPPDGCPNEPFADGEHRVNTPLSERRLVRIFIEKQKTRND
jgi:hypothetical protein